MNLSWFFGKMNTIDRPLSPLAPKKSPNLGQFTSVWKNSDGDI